MSTLARIALITGAAQGIGRRTAELLAERGYALALADLRHPTETLDALKAGNVKAIPLIGDIADEAVVARFADVVRQEFSRCDVLVNNAGISSIHPAETITAAEYRRVLEVNL